MAWGGTNENLTDVANELVLDEGTEYGVHTTGDLNLGAVGGGEVHRHVRVRATVEENPADTGAPRFLIEMRTHIAAGWNAYVLFAEGEYLCDQITVRITVWGDPQTGQRPKITALEIDGPPADAYPTPGNVASQLAALPAAPTFGDRHILNGDKAIYACVDSLNVVWRKCPATVGQLVWDQAVEEYYIYDENSAWTSCDATSTAPFRQHCHSRSYDAINPAGEGNTWQYTIDGLQDTNGYMETATLTNDADADYIDFKIGLKKGSYDFFFLTTTDVNHGIVEAQLDTVVKATWDCYDVLGLTRNVLKTQAAVAVTVAKTYTLRLKINGKNGGSGGHEMFVSWVAVAPA